VDDDTELDVLCDAMIFVLSDGVPQEQLSKLRKNVDRASWQIRPPDRETWGQRPDQIAAQERLVRSAGG
jgi:hypothetical protein